VPEIGHGHSHGLIDPTIQRSRAGIRAVILSLLVLAITALAQVAIFAISGSVALLADLIHNFGDAATAMPVAASRARRSSPTATTLGPTPTSASRWSRAPGRWRSGRRLPTL